jgi:hypothetical protein
MQFLWLALLARYKSHGQTQLEVLTIFKSASIERFLVTMKLSFLSIIIISVDLFEWLHVKSTSPLTEQNQRL